jgi:cytoskeletal protein CcmA (bactofilin family)
MFSDKSKTKTKQDFANEQNKIAQGTKIIGEIVSEGAIRIEGHFEGIVKAKGKVVIGKTGVVDGDIYCDCADIEGKAIGTLNVQSILSLKSTAVISGDVITDKLVVETGASFNATCKMGSEVKSLKDVPKKQFKEEKKAFQA